MSADPITELVEALDRDGKPPLPWVLRWAADGTITRAWAESRDGRAMHRVLPEALPWHTSGWRGALYAKRADEIALQYAVESTYAAAYACAAAAACDRVGTAREMTAMRRSADAAQRAREEADAGWSIVRDYLRFAQPPTLTEILARWAPKPAPVNTGVTYVFNVAGTQTSADAAAEIAAMIGGRDIPRRDA